LKLRRLSDFRQLILHSDKPEVYWQDCGILAAQFLLLPLEAKILTIVDTTLYIQTFALTMPLNVSVWFAIAIPSQ
jgi:ABC-type tungstate transport system substrate-binding protein